MTDSHVKKEIRSVLTLEPLLDFWRSEMVPHNSHMKEMFASLEDRIRQNPAINEEISDMKVLKGHQDLLGPLMSVVFPAAAWKTEIAAALKPFTSKAFYMTPAFDRLKLDTASTATGSVHDAEKDVEHERLLRAYAVVLDQLYQIPNQLDIPLVRVTQDAETGLGRYYRISLDFSFVRAATEGTAPEINDADRRRIMDNMGDVALLKEILPIHQFIFRGFTLMRGVDVTEPAVMMGLERDLVEQQSIFSNEGFVRLQKRLRTLFERPDLIAGISANQGEQVLMLNDGGNTNCLFQNSNHIPRDQLRGSVWMQALEKGDLLRVADLSKRPELSIIEKGVLSVGMHCLMVMPLSYRGEQLGTITIKAPKVGALGPLDEKRLKKIAPLFSVALKRGLDDINNEVQGIIKEKCTAVHPSVEWRFQEAALAHMELLRQGKASEMNPIIFKDVVPFFGQSDIRGSSEARNKSIQADLKKQLALAGDVVKSALAVRNWPLLQEYAYRIDKRMDQMDSGLSSEDESSVNGFLKNEVESTFEDLRSQGPQVARSIEIYQHALDPDLGMVYHKRKEFEQSVFALNERLSIYLDQCQAEAQETFPHYFEKHQTDGIDYVIYLGASMHPSGRLPGFCVKNLGLWQLMLACGMAWNTELIKPQVAVPLDTCHLVLYNRTPLSIRFRYDEKRFDVDGAYDVRHEIIKSRLDKAVIKGSRERLTQPGRIAIVYTNPKESREIRQHIEFLQTRGHLLKDLEQIELEDLPGVRGLKAMRVQVNLAAAAKHEQIFRAA